MKKVRMVAGTPNHRRVSLLTASSKRSFPNRIENSNSIGPLITGSQPAIFEPNGIFISAWVFAHESAPAVKLPDCAGFEDKKPPLDTAAFFMRRDVTRAITGITTPAVNNTNRLSTKTNNSRSATGSPFRSFNPIGRSIVL